MKLYKLLDSSGHTYLSTEPGTLGGHRGLKIYGLLSCASALRFIAAGKYVKHRVFFADMGTAMAAGYRPCAKCMPDTYKFWMNQRASWDKLVHEARQEAAASKVAANRGARKTRGVSTSSTASQHLTRGTRRAGAETRLP